MQLRQKLRTSAERMEDGVAQLHPDETQSNNRNNKQTNKQTNNIKGYKSVVPTLTMRM